MNTRTLRLSAFLILAAAAAAPASAQFREESRVDVAFAEHGVTGEGVIIAVFDRGIDYEHPDFINDDGTTRILAILDLSNNAGANDPDNPLSAGTVYTEAEINAALSSGTPLATRDAVGHGTLTAGIAGGNGRASEGEFVGVAPNARFIIVKFTSEGAPAHDGVPAEAPFYAEAHLADALDFVLAQADVAGMPVVVTANFGSIQGPSDGTSKFARIIDERFGPDKPGRVFISGSSDDGDRDNFASGSVAQGETVDLLINKGHAGNLRIDLWYDESDRFELTFVTPSGSNGPYAAPTTPTGFSNHSGSGFVLYQRARDIDFFESTSNRREVLIDIIGAPGDYILKLHGTTVVEGGFHAFLNPSNIFAQTDNRFESFVTPGRTIWDGASSLHTIVPNSYIHRASWTDINGVSRTYPGNDAGEGALWPGSGVGPTVDGRMGITVAAPGNVNTGPMAQRSHFSTIPSALVQGGEGMYGVLAFVSGANPVLTGTVALMLEADPTLDAIEIRDILVATAREDAFTGPTPNPQWGGGKLDAAAALDMVVPTDVEDTTPGPAGATLTIASIWPNPARDVAHVRYELQRPGNLAVRVADVLGRMVLERRVVAPTAGDGTVDLDVSALPAGLYIVSLRTDDGMTGARALVVR